jgi:hypothetical protein
LFFFSKLFSSGKTAREGEREVFTVGERRRRRRRSAGKRFFFFSGRRRDEECDDEGEEERRFFFDAIPFETSAVSASLARWVRA